MMGSIRFKAKGKALKHFRFKAVLSGGEGGSRTHAPFNRPNAFRVHPLRPLEYFSIFMFNLNALEKGETLKKTQNLKRYKPL